MISDNMLAKRKGEKYKRIKCSTLAKLMTECSYEESIYALNQDGGSMVGGDGMSQYEESKQGGESIQGLLNTGQNLVPNNYDAKS